MELEPEQVRKVSLLARLYLDESELLTMTQQLAQVVHYVDQLADLDTANVAPLAHPIEMSNVFADDVPRPSLAREAALANAPKHDGECYRVPAVLGE